MGDSLINISRRVLCDMSNIFINKNKNKNAVNCYKIYQRV